MTKQQRDDLKKLYHTLSMAVDQSDRRRDIEMSCLSFLKDRSRLDDCFKLIPFFEAKECVRKVAGATGQELDYLAMAMKYLEQYMLNLIRKPWCEDYYIIKTYNAYFKYNIERWISHDIAFRILQLIGYQRGNGEILKVSGNINQERVISVGFELYLAQLLIKFHKHDSHSVYHLMGGTTPNNYVSGMDAQLERHTVRDSGILKSETCTVSTVFDKDGRTIQQPFITAVTTLSSTDSQSDNLSLENIYDDQLYNDVEDSSGSDVEAEKYTNTHDKRDDDSKKKSHDDINHQGYQADSILRRRLNHHDFPTRAECSACYKSAIAFCYTCNHSYCSSCLEEKKKEYRGKLKHEIVYQSHC